MRAPQGIYKMPAGTYYVGDPCYSFNIQWESILEQTEHFRFPIFLDESDKPVVVAFPTAYGDGTYRDLDGTCYFVDAGLLGLVLCGTEDRNPKHARVAPVTFEGEVSCYVEEHGHVVVFSDGCKTISIVTDRERFGAD